MAKKKKTRRGIPNKTCPECGAEMHPRTRECAKCGHIFYGSGSSGNGSKKATAKKAPRKKATTAAASAPAASAAPAGSSRSRGTDVTLVLAVQRLIERAGGLQNAKQLVDDVGKAGERAAF